MYGVVYMLLFKCCCIHVVVCTLSYICWYMSDVVYLMLYTCVCLHGFVALLLCI